MKAVHLVPVGRAPIELLDELAASLARLYQVSCHVRTEALDAEFALDATRNQYHSSAILARLAPYAQGNGVRVLGITDRDLYVPVLTFVFGEAQLGGACALVSLHRLREEFYGLPPDPERLRQRLVVESVHELGHTFGLRHCSNWRCAMASSHAVERLDVKEPRYCQQCSRVVLSACS